MAEIGEKLISDSQMVIISVYSQRGDRSFNITYQASMHNWLNWYKKYIYSNF
jgi:hypothetical protein